MWLREFNTLDKVDALRHMSGCCHSHRWALEMLRGRPYADIGLLMSRASECWAGMKEADLLEAFKGHARIGDMEKLREKFSRANAEQGQVAKASEAVIKALWELNQQYEKRHGFIFIVCATGKSAEQMLAILHDRLMQSRATELKNAAAEQEKITAIRLRALLAEEFDDGQ